VWNLRHPDATRIDDDEVANELVEGALGGPKVPPGTYRVKLTVGDAAFEEEFEVRPDPRVAASADDHKAQFDVLMKIRDKLSETHTGVNQIRALKRRAEDWAARSKEKPELAGLHAAAQAVVDRLKPIEAELIQVEAKSRWDELLMPVKLNGKLAFLVGSVAEADGPPTQGAREVFASLSDRIDQQLSALQSAIKTEVEALNTAIRDAQLPPVAI
jgi:hypothetical protein